MNTTYFNKSLRGAKLEEKTIDLNLINKKLIMVIKEEFKDIKQFGNLKSYGEFKMI